MSPLRKCVGHDPRRHLLFYWKAKTLNTTMKDTDIADSPNDLERGSEEQRRSGISRVGGALGKSIVTVVKHTTPDAVKDVWRLARWETTNIRCWRTLIFFLLLITGAFVSSYTYVFLSREQDSDFRANVSAETILDLPRREIFLTIAFYIEQYNLFAARIEYAMYEESEAVALATQNIATTMSGAASSGDSTFPLVSLPLFEINGYTARSESTLELAFYTPLVTGSQKERWQSYAVDEMGWIKESREFLIGKGIEMNSTNTATNPFIWEFDERGTRIASRESPYLPLWQVRILLPVC